MLNAAREFARHEKLDLQVSFQLGDATNLHQFNDQSFDMVSCMGLMHHLPDLDCVKKAFLEMDRIAKPSGLVMVFDYVRFHTNSIIETYAEVTESDLLKDGLPDLHVDYKNSLHAAWTVSEIRSNLSPSSNRRWIHIFQRLLPSFQFVLGIPQNQKKIFLRKNLASNQMPFKGRELFPADSAMISFLLKTSQKSLVTNFPNSAA